MFYVIMRFELILVILVFAVACASSVPVPLSPLLPVEPRETGVFISLVSATVGFSRKQLQPRFGEAIEVYRPTTRNPDRISFMEYGENPTYLNDRFGVQSDDRYRKKPSYGVAYISPPQDPYLTDTARIKDLKNLQTFRQGDDIQKTPENSEVNTKENYDNAMSQSDEYYKNSQVYGGLYSNSKQLESHVNQATKDSLENQRPQNEDYKKIDYNDPKPQSQDTRKSSIDDAYRIQQTSTSAQLQYPHVDQKKMESYGNVGIQNDNSYKSQQSYSVSPSLNQGFRDGFPNTYDRNKSNKESSMLLHYPDHNPVLTPNQKITINIEYPTENYNHNAVYTTRAPLKRPQISRTTSKNPNESFRA